MDCCRCVYDGIVADGGSGLDDGGGDPGPEGWVGWSSRMAVGTLFATGSMSPHPHFRHRFSPTGPSDVSPVGPSPCRRGPQGGWPELESLLLTTR